MEVNAPRPSEPQPTCERGVQRKHAPTTMDSGQPALSTEPQSPAGKLAFFMPSSRPASETVRPVPESWRILFHIGITWQRHTIGDSRNRRSRQMWHRLNESPLRKGADRFTPCLHASYDFPRGLQFSIITSIAVAGVLHAFAQIAR